MKTPNTCLTRTIHMPGFGSAASAGAGDGPGSAMPRPSTNGSASAIVVPVRVQVAREEHDLNDDRRDARAGEQRGDGAHAERQQERAAARFRRTECRSSTARSRSTMTSNIARPSNTKSTAMAILNQGDALIVPNVPAVRMTTRPSTP